MVSEKVLEKESSERRIRIYKETEYSLQRQLNLMKDQLLQLQSSHDSTQARLVDYRLQYDQEVATKLGELEIVVTDLERARMSCRKIKVQDAEISNLLDDLDKLKTRKIEKEASSGRRINERTRAFHQKLDLEQLRKKLLQFDDYERIKRDGADKSLERLLMDKNKRLQGEATGLKDALEAAQADLRFSQEELESVKLHGDTRRQLIEKLEEDMCNLNSIDALHSGAVSKAFAPVKAAASRAAEGDMHPLMALIVAPIAVGAEAAGVGGVIGPVHSGAANSSIVPFLASQRDRYRQRNAELEDLSFGLLRWQAKQYSRAIADLKCNVESLKNDNVKLYEKLRCAESFSKALLRRVQKLNPAEKAALVFTRILVGNKYTRVGFVVYSVVLHLLVFATLFLLCQWKECRHDHVVPKPPSNIH
ncbi:CASP C terminal-domain-containing protein [Chytriomyces sp. MP71]|nr:CASP C terminal-domain-containing protein [Chytriomyces sp. MP71]